MLLRTRCVVAVLGAALLAGSVQAASLTDTLKEKGNPGLKSAGPLAFAPEGILLVGDPMAATIFAIDTNDRPSTPAAGQLNVEKVNEKIASMLGTNAQGVRIVDLAVNPASGNAYLSVARGQGPDTAAVIMRVTRQGKVEEFPLKDVRYAKSAIPNAPANVDKPAKRQPTRRESITGLGYVKGNVIVAGLSSEEFASTLRSIPFPFTDADKGTSVEIFHAGHNAVETHAPVRTFPRSTGRIPRAVSGRA